MGKPSPTGLALECDDAVAPPFLGEKFLLPWLASLRRHELPRPQCTLSSDQPLALAILVLVGAQVVKSQPLLLRSYHMHGCMESARLFRLATFCSAREMQTSSKLCLSAFALISRAMYLVASRIASFVSICTRRFP